MTTVKDVDNYIANAPKEMQAKLQELRSIIKSVVPQVDEYISYGMPYYGYKGRLAYFALAKNHIGLYLMPPIIENHKKELEDYQTAKSTIQFPLTDDLPVGLIKKLIKEGIKNNEAKSK